jgi:DnaK suppressor protein
VDRLSQVGVHDKLQVTLADVDRALVKLEDGSYGVCDVCGKPIGDGRLQALPWAVLCVEDAGRR